MTDPIKLKRGFLRNNVEAFAVAIVMALVIKTFAIEAFQVPTPSMEPTIIGRAPGGDRIIVNKNRYQWSDPSRYDVVVFRYPLSRMVNYVKRCIGLPGERVVIAHGDIYVGKNAEDLQVSRKPIPLMDTMFLENPAIPEDVAESFQPTTFRKWWGTEGDQDRYRLTDGTLKIDAKGGPAMVRTAKPLTLRRRDKYADDPNGDAPMGSEPPTGDLRLDLSVELHSGSGALVMEIDDATQPGQALRLVLEPKGSEAKSRLSHGTADVTPEGLRNLQLPTGTTLIVRFENCDDRVRILVDDEEIAAYLYEQAPIDAAFGGIPSKVGFGIQSGSATFHFAKLYRDLYYTPYHPKSLVYEVPEDCFLFFGDNSPSSLDARGWRVSGIRIRETGEVVLGDLEAVSDDFAWPRRRSNPYFETEKGSAEDPGSVGPIQDEQEHRFLDIHGNVWRLTPGSYDVLNLNAFDLPGIRIIDLHGTHLPTPAEGQVALEAVSTARLKEMWTLKPTAKVQPLRDASRLMHYVHRRDIMGQANLVFWPPKRWGVIR
jgi:signal peptidase I